MYIIGLVDLNKAGIIEIDKINFKTDVNTNFEEVEEIMRNYCKLYEKELKDGYWLFIASKDPDGKYEAKYRADYAEWMLEEDPNCTEPYYIDVAEHDERVLFHMAVNDGVPFSEREFYISESLKEKLIAEHIGNGWEFEKIGEIIKAFHPDYGVTVFDNEQEFKEWLIL